MNVYQVIHETLNLDATIVQTRLGVGDPMSVIAKRQRVLTFLETHEWDLDAFTAWLVAQPPQVVEAPVLPPQVRVRVEGKQRVIYYVENDNEVILGTEEIVMPTLLQQAKNLTRSVVDWAKAGFPLSKEQTARWEICEACPDLIGGRCRYCGCGMRRKIQLDTARCYLGKW